MALSGTRYWLRRRKSASERKVSLKTSLGLSDAYDDLFDRIRNRREAWIIATGHLLLHALYPYRDSSSAKEASALVVVVTTSGGADEAQQREDNVQDTRYQYLVDNCVCLAWYDGTPEYVCDFGFVGLIHAGIRYCFVRL